MSHMLSHSQLVKTCQSSVPLLYVHDIECFITKTTFERVMTGKAIFSENQENIQIAKDRIKIVDI